MLRILLAALLFAFPSLGRAQEYFIVCQRATDIFVLAHTWKYAGYAPFERALYYYHREKRYNGVSACKAFSGYLGTVVQKGPILGEYELMLPGEYTTYLRFFAWQGESEGESFTVLSTIAP